MVASKQRDAIKAIFRDTVQDLDGRVIKAAEKADDATRDTSKKPLGKKSLDTPHPLKRKREGEQYDDGGDPSKSGPKGIHPPATKKDEQQRKRMARCIAPMRTVELQKQYDFTNQYDQGKSVSDMPGVGCGTHLLGVSSLPFISPLHKDMHIEIMSGLGDGDGSGCLRINEKTDSIHGSTFIFPTAHIEQALVLLSPQKSDDDAYRVIVVPSAAAGASGFTRDVPRVMVFCLPNRKAGNELQGTVGEGADTHETYLSVFERVFNSILKPHGKQVVKPDREDFISKVPAYDEEGSPCLYTHTDSGDGAMYFLPTGVFIGFRHPRLYFPFQSIKTVKLEATKETDELDIVFTAYEPFYKTKKSFQRRTSGLKMDDMAGIREYFSKHQVRME